MIVNLAILIVKIHNDLVMKSGKGNRMSNSVNLDQTAPYLSKYFG